MHVGYNHAICSYDLETISYGFKINRECSNIKKKYVAQNVWKIFKKIIVSFNIFAIEYASSARFVNETFYTSRSH